MNLTADVCSTVLPSGEFPGGPPGLRPAGSAGVLLGHRERIAGGAPGHFSNPVESPISSMTLYLGSESPKAPGKAPGKAPLSTYMGNASASRASHQYGNPSWAPLSISRLSP